MTYYMVKDKYLDFFIFNSVIGGICHYPLHSEAATGPDTHAGMFILVPIQQKNKYEIGRLSTDYIPWDHHIHYTIIRDLNFPYVTEHVNH